MTLKNLCDKSFSYFMMLQFIGKELLCKIWETSVSAIRNVQISI